MSLTILISITLVGWMASAAFAFSMLRRSHPDYQRKGKKP